MRRHGPMVLGVCLRALGDYHAAEDAFQATFMVLALKSRAIRKQESLGPWLHGVAVRIAPPRARRAPPEQGRAACPRRTVADPAAHDPASVELSAVLDEEVGRLPEKYRLPVVLCYLEGQTQDEAARTLGWTKGTVSGRLARAKDLLRHRLTRRGLAPSAALLAAALTSQTRQGGGAARRSCCRQSGPRRPRSWAARRPAWSRVGSPSLAQRGTQGHVAGAARPGGGPGFRVLGLGAAALATPMLLPVAIPSPPRNLGGGPPVAAGRSPTQPVSTVDPAARSLRRPIASGAAHAAGHDHRRRHTTGVAGIDFTRDGTAAVTAQNDGLVRFWDAETGRQVRAIDMMADAPTPR